MFSLSHAHVYLTVPFVLSWSMLNAMSCGCPLVASDTQPVREVIIDGQNGLVHDFFDADAIAEAVLGLLHDPALRGAPETRLVQRFATATALK